jgi:hypothetical protein
MVLIHAHKSCLLALYLSACFLGRALLCNACMEILRAGLQNLDVFCIEHASVNKKVAEADILLVCIAKGLLEYRAVQLGLVCHKVLHV